MELKKIAVIAFVLAFVDSLLLTLIGVFLQAIGVQGLPDILKQIIGTITQILGFIGLVAFCIFVLSALGLAFQKFPKRDDDLIE